MIHFFPNSWDLRQEGHQRTIDGKAVEELYDPNVRHVLEEIAKLAGQFGAARIVIEGHTDSSMKGQVPAHWSRSFRSTVPTRSRKRWSRSINLDPNKFNVDGVGWDRPADPTDPMNHAKNRRVEVKVSSG